MKEPFRLLIAVPSTDYMHAEFVRSLMKLTGYLQREGIRHETEPRRSPAALHDARLAKRSRESAHIARVRTHALGHLLR